MSQKGKGNKLVQVRMPPNLLVFLEQEAAAEKERSVGYVIRELIRAEMARRAAAKPAEK